MTMETQANSNEEDAAMKELEQYARGVDGNSSVHEEDQQESSPFKSGSLEVKEENDGEADSKGTPTLEDDATQPAESQQIVLADDDECFCPPPAAVPLKKGKGKGKTKANQYDHESSDTASQAPSEASSKSKRMGVGQKKSSKSHTRYCKGCALYYIPSDMASKSCMCHSCKYAMDTVSRLAIADGHRKWATDIRADPSALQKVISKYKEMTGGDGVRRKVPKNTMMQSLQKVSAKSRILFDTAMEMMSEDKFMSHSATEEGGRMSKAAAVAQWKSWEEQIGNGTAPDDLIWDTKKGYLRIAVSVKDTVHLQNEPCSVIDVVKCFYFDFRWCFSN